MFTVETMNPIHFPFNIQITHYDNIVRIVLEVFICSKSLSSSWRLPEKATGLGLTCKCFKMIIFIMIV